MGNCLDRSRKQAVDPAAEHKKTDAPTPDDDEVTSGGSEVKRGERQEAQEQRDKTSGESGASESARQEQRDEESVVTEETRQREQSLSSEPQPNRTDPAAEVEKEVEVHVQHQPQEEEAPESRGSNKAAVLRNGDVTPSTVAESEPTKKDAVPPTLHNGDIVENGLHDNDNPAVENSADHVAAEEEKVDKKRWSFPPVLDDFNLMESDVDPADLEAIFTDDRLKEISLHIQQDSPGLGISIVGGSGSPSGDLPILIKRVLPQSLAEEDGRLKQGDELVAVNDTLLIGMSKDFAINALSNMRGDIRLLVLQED